VEHPGHETGDFIREIAAQHGRFEAKDHVLAVR
jgi:hypothetical protein